MITQRTELFVSNSFNALVISVAIAEFRALSASGLSRMMIPIGPSMDDLTILFCMRDFLSSTGKNHAVKGYRPSMPINHLHS
jgi:hypothetical protein